MRIRRPLPMSDPGQFQTNQAAAHSKNRDKFTPRKSTRNPKRQNMVININGYKRWARKCRKQITYRHNLRILCQGREDNPLHTDAFNVLIENLKEKIQYGIGPLLIVNVQ